MKHLYANSIHREGEIIHGLVGIEITFIDNVRLIYDKTKANYIINVLMKATSGWHAFTRYCQFVIYMNYNPNVGVSMKISDYTNDIDVMLEEYSDLVQKGWDKVDRDKIAEIVLSIQKYNENPAYLIVQTPI